MRITIDGTAYDVDQGQVQEAFTLLDVALERSATKYLTQKRRLFSELRPASKSGRPSEHGDKSEQIRQMIADGVPIAQIVEKLKVSRSTIYRLKGDAK